MTTHSTDLPGYATYAAADDLGAAPTPRWPFGVIAVIGGALTLIPVILGMFVRAAPGQRMLTELSPYMSDAVVESLRADLGVVDDARTNVVALTTNGHAPAGTYSYVDTFVRDYPDIHRHMSALLDVMAANVGNYEQLSSLPPFGALPWFFVLPGIALALTGILGVRRAADAKSTRWVTAVAAVLAAGSIAAPVGFGIFGKAPAATPLLDDFGPIMTTEQVRTVQGYFVTLVGGAGELDSRYTKDARAADPTVDLTGIDALTARWQPMTSDFAGLIGAMNDNVANFAKVVELDRSTERFGFSALANLGWFFAVPGSAVLVTLGIATVRSRKAKA